MTKMGHEYQSIQWWSSQIATRNTLVSSLFLLLIPPLGLRNFEKKIRIPMCIICESTAVLESLSIPNLNRVIWIESSSKIRQKLFLWLRRIFYVSRVCFLSSVARYCLSGNLH